jgi:hypothetical protein
MIRGCSQIGKKKRLASWAFASAPRLDSDEHSVNLVDRFPVVRLRNPALLRSVALKENTDLRSLVPIRSSLAPGFERACVLEARTLVQIVSVEDEQLSLGVENASGSLPRVAVSRYVINFRNVQVARSDQFPDVAVFRQQIPLFGRKIIGIPGEPLLAAE